ncbi:MAG: CHAP domain-containing protein [Rhodobacteraceae bacterium]|jgi:surface antigen|nr:CHAP domain-containing protein [Paracoccaceae bacterium]
MKIAGTMAALRRLTVVCLLPFVAACAATKPELMSISSSGLDPARAKMAFVEVQQKKAKGQRVWCVPFARTMSGVNIRGNAGTWWGQAAGSYGRGQEPEVGSVMAFASTRKMPMGHVAVVSGVVSPREILIDHANWHRNQVSLKMKVVDVSDKNDWSRVRVESNPGTLGGVYPINGFIYPGRAG